MTDADGDEARIRQQFGDRLRQLRAEHGMSQAELAHQAQLHPTYVSSVERGQRNVSLVNIVRLADALGISTSELMTF